MSIREIFRQIRIVQGMSQEDVERNTGLLRCYVSRVENGQPVASIHTFVKWAQAFEGELYELFVEGIDSQPLVLEPASMKCEAQAMWHDAENLRWAQRRTERRLQRSMQKSRLIFQEG